jgi:hypothetical protein
MEVASLLTTEKNVETLFKEFIFNYEPLLFESQDENTYYFTNRTTGKYEIFYHFNNNVDYELSYNFSPKNLSFISSYFGSEPIFLIDISFSNKTFFLVLMRRFIDYLIIKDDGESLSKIIIDDPFRGVLIINNKGDLVNPYSGL